jgi:hypothetical protein
MNEFTNLRQQMRGILTALAVGVPAGFLFAWLHTPIPWMLGPMIAVASLNLMGVSMHSPPYARQLGQVILGRRYRCISRRRWWPPSLAISLRYWPPQSRYLSSASSAR